MIEIRYVQESDWEFWRSLDKHVTQTAFLHKVSDRQGYVLLAAGRPVGLLRYNLFWDEIPFCNLLILEEAYRGQGYGTQLRAHWEGDMAAQGYRLVLTSTQTDEQAQHFYRKLGYRDCGGLLLDLPPYEQPMELFLRKGLENTN